jgi:hypothetical protein
VLFETPRIRAASERFPPERARASSMRAFSTLSSVSTVFQSEGRLGLNASAEN